MSDAKAVLRERARQIAVSPGALDRTMEKVDRRLRRRRVGTAFVASALTISSLALLVVTFVSPEPRAGQNVTSRRNEATVKLPGTPTSVSVDGTAVWIAVSGGHSDGEVVQAAAREPRITQSIGDADLGLPGARSVHVSNGAVWVAIPTSTEGEGRPSAGSVVRLDAATGRVEARIRFPSVTPLLMSVGAGAVWVVGSDSSGNGAVVRLDPTTNDLTASLSLPYVPTGVAVADDGLWIVGPGRGTAGSLTRVDSKTNEVVASKPLSVAPSDIAVGAGAVWVVGAGREETGVLVKVTSAHAKRV